MDHTRTFRKAMLRRLLDAAGLATLVVPVAYGVGCGGKVAFDHGSGAGAGGHGGETSAGGGTSSLTGGDTDGGACTPSPSNGDLIQITECITPVKGACPSIYEVTLYLGPSVPCANLVSIDCGPYAGLAGTCCYLVTEEQGSCGSGRPFRIEGETRLAQVEDGDHGWADVDLAPSLDGLDAAARAALADAWTRDALLEHASIPTFSRFAMQLLAVGAPSDLVAAAHRAALDEVRHARLCFALAGAYRGAPVAPSRFPFDAAVAIDADLAQVAAATAREGCIGETIAVVAAAEQLARATDPAVRRVLAALADDEARHAELAWRVVAWALDRGDARVRAAVSEVLGNAARSLPRVAADDALPPDVAAAHGRLDRSSAHRTLVRAFAEVVLPCAEALLGPGAGHRPSGEIAAEDAPSTQRSFSHDLGPLRALRARG